MAAAAAAKKSASCWQGAGAGPSDSSRRRLAGQGKQLARQGMHNLHLLERARCLAPLQRLFQSWLQQLYQLLMRYGHMEVRASFVRV